MSKVPDPRRRAGSRHPLPSLLAMVVLGNLSGYYGYRQLARFMKRHAWEFVRLFGFKHGVPGHLTIREVVGMLDFESRKQAFQAWLGQLQAQPVGQAAQGQQGAYSIDGKSLKSTLLDYPQSYQDFVAMVQVLAHQSGLVVGQQPFHNGQQDEARVVRALIAKLDLKGAILTMDALQCQKKR